MQHNVENKGPVWVVDDDDVRNSIRFALATHGLDVHTYSSGEAFLSTVDLSRAGCLVLDLRMAGMNGIDVQNALIERGSPIAIIFLSGHGNIKTAVSTMEAGAVSFLEKPVDPEELLSSIEKALAISHRAYQTMQVKRLLGSLSKRERQIFDLICQGYKNTSIAETLYLSQRTVEVHRAHISRKLGDNTPISLLYELNKTALKEKLED